MSHVTHLSNVTHTDTGQPGEMTFRKGQTDKDFETTCFESALGVVHGPVKTRFGFHLVLVNQRSQGLGAASSSSSSSSSFSSSSSTPSTPSATSTKGAVGGAREEGGEDLGEVSKSAAKKKSKAISKAQGKRTR